MDVAFSPFDLILFAVIAFKERELKSGKLLQVDAPLENTNKAVFILAGIFQFHLSKIYRALGYIQFYPL